MEQIDAVSRLVSAYRKLPGIGAKTAERLAYATLEFSKDDLEEFIASLQNVIDKVRLCPKCHMAIDTEKCPICDDEKRNHKTLMVISEAKNILSFEKGNYQGLYFVLGGNLSAVKGIGPEQLRIPELKQRVIDEKISEVILACSSTMEGELTAKYLDSVLEGTGTKVTRLAYGLPLGTDIEYVDELTIQRALALRTTMKGNN